MKKKIYSQQEVADATLRAIFDRDLEGVYPSGIDGNWHWQVIESGGYAFGVCLRFRIDRNCKCYAMSFNDAGYDAIYDEYCNVTGYSKREEASK